MSKHDNEERDLQTIEYTTLEREPKCIMQGLQLALAGKPQPQGLIFFCAADLDLDTLAQEIHRNFPCPTTGCTSAGQIGQRGYQDSAFVALALYAPDLIITNHLIQPLSDCNRITAQLGTEFKELRRPPPYQAAGFVLVDGLSFMEERVAAALQESFSGLPIVGGSAGDDLKMISTKVYYDGRFLEGAAVLSLIQTTLPMTVVKIQHGVVTDQVLVVTHADPETRTIYELNGEPAAAKYAEAVGVKVDELDSVIFAEHPLILSSHGDDFLRSASGGNPDGSLSMFSFVAEGLLLSVGKTSDPMAALQDGMHRVHVEIGEPSLLLACDCRLRRNEFIHTGEEAEIGGYLAENRVFGFSTYGEQFDGLHLNQTFTALAFGRSTS